MTTNTDESMTDLAGGAAGQSLAAGRTTVRWPRRGALVLAVFLALAGAAAFLIPQHYKHVIYWRLQIYGRKMTGRLPELRWSELLAMTAGHDRFALGNVITQGRSAEAVLLNPYDTEEGRRAGAALFHTHCSACHGNDARGGEGHAPSLVRENYIHGDSVFAIYKVLRDGVPGTAMVPRPLSFAERWQVVAYLQSLRRKARPQDAARAPPIHVTSADLNHAGTRTDEWLTYSGSLKGWRYSPLSQLTPGNVGQLRLLWLHQFPSERRKHESTPLLIDRTLFVTESPNNVVALDASTGREIWRYDRALPTALSACCGSVNRGLAALGRNLYLATLDAHLIALDASTGNVVWDTVVADWNDHYTMTLAPLAFADMVVAGVSGGEYGAPGFIAAYDASTGALRWRFNTIPGPGEPGHETWSGDAWRTGGAAAWVTGSYDAESDLLYWGVGNPAPVYDGDSRPGDNLYSNSVVALHARTGKLAWYYQFTPHDEHDWDSNQTPVLADLVIKGVRRKVICWANRNGFYYVLDRLTGELLQAQPFTRQNWALGIDAKGRPIPNPDTRVSREGRLTYPGAGGATNWQPPAFDPRSGVIFVHTNDQGSIFTKTGFDDISRGSNDLFVGSGAAPAGPPVLSVRALEAATGTRLWSYDEPPFEKGSQGFSGLLATGGGLVLGAAGGRVFALDATHGRLLWRAVLSGMTYAPPITFELDGKQVVAVWGGRSLFLFGL